MLNHVLFGMFTGSLASGLAPRRFQIDRYPGFQHDIGHTAQFLVLGFQSVKIRVTSRESTQLVLQIGIKRVNISGVVIFVFKIYFSNWKFHSIKSTIQKEE